MSTFKTCGYESCISCASAMADEKGQGSNCKSFGHVLDFSTLRLAEGVGCSPSECVVDVWCKVCGASGSATVYADDVMFDDEES